MRRITLGIMLAVSFPCFGQGEPQMCSGDYAEDLSALKPEARALESKPYSFCVRNTAVYECLSYGGDGGVRKTRRKAILHGTGFAYKQQNGQTLLLTNEHVAEWPPVTDDTHPVDGVPAGCKRISETLRIVDNEEDRYETDDIALTRVVADVQLDAAILRANVLLPVLPWKLGRSAALKERDLVEVRGFPLGAFQATNVGKVVSAYDHDDERDWDHDDFVIDALLSSGNSGSPVLAVSCKTGEFELVGIYHAGYTQGSALNVVVAIDQLRELMTTLKRTPRVHADPVAAADPAARDALNRALGGSDEPFFPFGSLTAAVRARSDGALVFEVFGHDFPFRTAPVLAYEDLPSPSGFGEVGRVWFGAAGLKAYQRADLDADAQALVARTVDALRRDALSFVGWRLLASGNEASREDFERAGRTERTLARTVQSRRELASALVDAADRLGPRPPEAGLALRELFVPPPAPLAVAPPALAPPKIAPADPTRL